MLPTETHKKARKLYHADSASLRARVFRGQLFFVNHPRNQRHPR